MNKKLLLIWTFLLCFVMGMSADQVTITFKDNGGTKDNNSSTTAMADLVTEESQALLSGFKASGKVYQAMDGLGIKFGNSSGTGTVELTLKETYKATKLIITAAGYADNSNTFSVNGTNVTGFAKKKATVQELTLKGDDLNKITVSTITGQTRGYLQSITIVYGTGGGTEQPTVDAPTIEGTTPFLGTTTVTLACATADAKVYYTLDGTEPTNASSEYAEPFTLNATTTVKAIAYKGETASTVATKEFVKTPEVATIAELTALENNATFAYTGELTVVAAPTAKHLFVKDAAGNAVLIFDNAGKLAFEAGQHVAAGWQGKVSVYNNLFEVVPTTDLTAVADVKDEIAYDEAAAADVTVENANKVVLLNGVTYTAPADGSKNFEIKAGETTVNGYNQFGIDIAAPAEGSTYNILGAISRYKDQAQFQPITITRNPNLVDTEVTVPANGDIYEAVDVAKTAIVNGGDKVGDVSITLEANSEYTISKAITSAGDVKIEVYGEGQAKISAVALEEPFIKLEGNTTPAQNADGTENANYKKVNLISIKGVNISGLKTNLINDAQKSLISAIDVDNSVINVEGSANIFDFKGYPTLLQISNSTLWSKDGHTGQLIKTAGRVRDLDSDQTLYTEATSILNSTLYQIAVGKQLNNLQGKGQKSLQFNLKNSIIYNSTQDGNEVRGWLGGQNSTNPKTEYDNNTYWNGETSQEGWEDETKQGADATGTAKNFMPEFKDAANGDFTVYAGSLQAKYKIGDPRWLVEYDKTLARPINLDLEIENGEDITAVLAEVAQQIDNIGSIDMSFAPDAKCTLTAPIEIKAPLYMHGDNTAPATIDASANSGAFIQLSATPDESLKGTDNDYYHIKGHVSLNNLNINGVKGQLVYDNNVKYCVENLVIDSCNVKLQSDEATGVNGNAVIYFKGGFANTLSVSHSTFWQNGASDAKYFVQYNNNGRATRAGYENNFVIFQNNTFSNVAKEGQWANYGGFAGQKTSGFIVTDNIFSNCGNMQIARRILGGRTAASYAEGMVTFNNNTYMTKTVSETEVVEAYENATGYDESGTIIEMDPLFADADNGNFTIGASTKQAKLKTGDPRWLVEFVPEDVTDAKAELKAEIEKATALLGDADTENDPAAKALKEAIDKAQNVYDNSEFNEELEDATDDLIEAEEAYKTSAVSSINAESSDRGAWYTLQGVRVEKPAKGIFIHNGKKVILK